MNASFEDLWKVQQDEWMSFETFRRSVERAINEAAATAVGEEELAAAARRIERELVEEPLAKLEERLRRLERIRRRKYAAYAIVPVTTAVVAAVRPEAAPAVGAALGSVSILKIMEAYFGDMEKDVGLSTDALYWLARLRREMRKG